MEKVNKRGSQEKNIYIVFTIRKICEDLEKAGEKLEKFLDKNKDNPLAKHTSYYDEYFLMVKDEFIGDIKLTKGLYHLRCWFE